MHGPGDRPAPVGAPIGVLAVQGDFAAHAAMLRRLGREVILVRTPGELAAVSALILPGGESTTMLRFLDRDRLTAPLLELAGRGVPILGTCAGLILLAREVSNPVQPSLGLLDVHVERNGYGRQIESFIDAVEAPHLAAEPLEGVFIRAPVILEYGSSVEVLGTCGGRPVLVQQGPLLACTFHPELSQDTTVHRHLVDLIPSPSGPAAREATAPQSTQPAQETQPAQMAEMTPAGLQARPSPC
jgi:5'-phosphate synthase pdxT subunit